ncbi:Zn-ribbon domain-containing OB-fold protein [Natrialba aegyptia]|uniref:ChsH2 C-terminal OB-fold domain-containing protein n=1 Tax=Natrialba aegyptia DSM 13077 TaxID=1227491 RepID=M0B8K6_9EURY|nr:Zn-ribbon domain-containing OB-fold protein [Natrialba aegyptia]ELZ07246.1 hypothetical protein C480_04301 [Natrialba aegyptia DSM 13077]
MSDESARDAGFDDWLDAAETGDAYYLECPAGHTSLPPRRLCPTCGAAALDERPLPETGEIETFTVTHVPTPAFEDDAPYATAIADFGPIRVTGQVVDLDPDAVDTGLPVELDVTSSETTGERVLGFKTV